MKRFMVGVFLCAAFPISAGAGFFDDDMSQQNCISQQGAAFETGFSEQGNLTAHVVKAIGSAKKSIRVSARDFVSKPVAEALVKAARSKVDVKVMLDGKTNQGVLSAGQLLLAMDVIPRLTRQGRSLHASYIVIDDRDVVLGDIASFTDETEEKQNTGNVLVVHGVSDLARKYLTQWQSLWGASDELKPLRGK